MRLDHYKKLGNNNIHLASIIYSIVTTIALTSFLVYKLSRDLKFDFSNIEILSLQKKQKRVERLSHVKNNEEDTSALTNF